MTSAAAADAVLADQASRQAADRRFWAGWRSQPARLLPLVPAIAELAVGGYKIGSLSLWRDEGDTLSAATRPVRAILALIHHQDAVHGLYYLLMHVVVAVFGTSPAALRLPSLLATAAAAALTAVLGRRLAAASGLPAPDVTGMTAGLLYMALPRTTWYAQDARPYAIATLLAVGATYLLVRAWDDGGVRWWAAYALVMVLLAAMNLLAVVLLAPHALALLAVRRQASPGTPAAGTPRASGPEASGPEASGPEAGAPGTAKPAVRFRPWPAFGIAAAAVLVCITPLAVLAGGQTMQISWIHRPGPGAIAKLAGDFSGIAALEPLILGLAALALVLEALRWRQPGCTLAKITLPWLLLPPVILMVASRVHTPVYDERYVLYCMPAIALLAAGGLSGLVRLTRPLVQPAGRLALTAPVLLAAVIGGLLIAPQQHIRNDSSRPDDLAKVAAVLTARERPGDAVLYVPWAAKVVSQAYPAAYARLRDIAQLKSPEASATLRGTTISARALERRFLSVRRVWVIQMGNLGYTVTHLGQVEYRLLRRMRLAASWHIKSVLLSLYVR
jgi:mannosyltransferase